MSKFYKPSGYFETKGVFLVFFGVAVVAALLAVPYALAVWYCPIVYLAVFLPILYAKLVGWFSFWVIRRGQIRNSQLANLIGALGSVPGLYLAWASWAVLVNNIEGLGSLSLGWRTVTIVESSLPLAQVASQFLDPLDILRKMSLIGGQGLWKVEGISVNGLHLYGIWILEALLFLFFASRSFGKWAKLPYSERVNKWFPKIKLAKALALPAEVSVEDVFRGLKAGQVGSLMDPREESNPSYANHCRLILYYLPKAEDAYVTVYGYALKESGSLKKSFLARYLKVPEEVGQRLYERLK
ncbi:MAG: hypothetical protein LBR11_01785 [Deltaproteobacteria bacterium]|jgi:hypothetical protein|nr:hypothetical protein [Deltaproteobacteria bacterium]